MIVRASVVLPLPRPPESVTRSQGCSASASMRPSRSVPAGSASGTVQATGLACGGWFIAKACLIMGSLRRKPLPGAVGREDAGDGGAAARRRGQFDPPAVQFHEGPDDGQPEPDAAMARAKRVALEPVEDARYDLRRD